MGHHQGALSKRGVPEEAGSAEGQGQEAGAAELQEGRGHPEGQRASMAGSEKLGSSNRVTVTGDPRWGKGLVLRRTNHSVRLGREQCQ